MRVDIERCAGYRRNMRRILVSLVVFACGNDHKAPIASAPGASTPSAAAPAESSLRSEKSLEIFDAHLHYNNEALAQFSSDQVVETFRASNVTGIIASSLPNTGTIQLFEAKPAGVRVVPFIRPYRVLSDRGTWFMNPTTWDLIQKE